MTGATRKAGRVGRSAARPRRARLSPAELASLVEHSCDAIFSYTPEGIIVSWNAAAERIFGFTAAEAAGHDAADLLVPPEARGEAVANRKRLREGEVVPDYETARLTRDGRRIEISLSMFPIKNARGEVTLIGAIARDVTRRTHSGRISARLAAIVESSNDAIMSRDNDGIVLSWNPGAERMFGYSAAEMVGHDAAFRLIPPERVDEAEKRRSAMRGDKPVDSYETERMTKDGRRIPVSITVWPMRDSAGNITSAAVTFRDITQQKRAEELRTQLAAIVANSNDAILSRTLDGTVLSWNAGAERMLGHTAAEMIGRNLALTRPPGRPANLARNNAMLLRGEVVVRESDRLTRDGRVINVMTSHSPVRDPTGNIVGASVILQDITALKRAEAAVRESEQRFRAIFDHAGVGITLRPTLDRQSPWTQVNDHFCKLFGYTQQELLGLSTRDITPADEEAIAIDGNRRLIAGEIASYSREKRVIRKDGASIWVYLTVAALPEVDGRPKSLIAVYQDITERKLAEQRVREINVELEQRVTERTLQLAATNKELEAFSYSVSHDLRAPLRGIDGFSHLLLTQYGERLDEPGRGYLERIRRATTRMGELIDDLLQLAKVSGRKLVAETVDVSALARLALAELQEQQPARTVAVELQEGVRVRGDRQLLRIVIENLLGNAWKFSSRRQAAVIRFGARERDGEQVIFVGDNGAGFNMKYADKLFGVFQRLHSASEFEGTGIGLATVQRIIKLHGGRIWADGAVDQGSTFSFTLPGPAA